MRELDKILDDKEKVYLEGTPKFWPFFLGSSIVTTIFGLFWMMFLLPFLGIAIYNIFLGNPLIGFGIMLMPHFWIGLIFVFGVPIYQLLLYKHVYYAITDKRAIIQKGLIGRDFEILDFDKITNAEVNMGVFDKLFGGTSGSILLSTAGTMTYNNGNAIQKPHTLRNIPDPYKVFKFFKKISHDVKTDVHYPNKLRPKTNPGYKTKYKPKK